jgi:exodeoxyribonuclease-3
MKITTWNVNGYRAVIRKNALDWVDDWQPDILCLQEIKVKTEQLSEDLRERENYSASWNSAERPGYSGTAVFYKPVPEELVHGLGAPEFDDEGRVIRLKYPDFYLYNIYFPNGGQANQRVPYKLDFYAFLLEQIDALHKAGEQVIITGDFNTAHNEIDIARPKENANNTGFLREERDWIDKYLEHDLVDAFRELYPDRVQYTWWSMRLNARPRNVGWRLDYFLISKGLMERVQDVIVHDEIMGSDHCPVSLLLNEN